MVAAAAAKANAREAKFGFLIIGRIGLLLSG
jgi:hypothetical protein